MSKTEKLVLTLTMMLFFVVVVVSTIRGSQPTEVPHEIIGGFANNSSYSEHKPAPIVGVAPYGFEPVGTKVEPTEPEMETGIEMATIEQVAADDLELLARIITAEAGGCSYECQYYVACVVMNRIEFGYWGSTLREVIYAPGQYSPTWNGAINKEPTALSYEIAQDVLINGSGIPADVIWQAEFPQGSNIWKQIDGMYFCHR